MVQVEVKNHTAEVQLGQRVSGDIFANSVGIHIEGTVVQVRPLKVRLTDFTKQLINVRPGYLIPVPDGTLLEVTGEPVKPQGVWRRLLGVSNHGS